MPSDLLVWDYIIFAAKIIINIIIILVNQIRKKVECEFADCLSTAELVRLFSSLIDVFVADMKANQLAYRLFSMLKRFACRLGCMGS